MSQLRVERLTPASAAACWAYLADFGQIDLFNPHLSGSHLLPGSPESGLGCERQCDLKDGRNHLRERVVDWQEGRSYTVQIIASTMPIRDAFTTLALEPVAQATRLVMEMRYEPRFGLLGQVADSLILRRKMASLMRGVLQGLAEKAEGKGQLAA